MAVCYLVITHVSRQSVSMGVRHLCGATHEVSHMTQQRKTWSACITSYTSSTRLVEQGPTSKLQRQNRAPDLGQLLSG